ncbi:putative cysteine protease atg4 [Bienertia sinuspersici]
MEEKRENERDDEGERVKEMPSKTPETEKPRKGKSCKGTLYFSSHLKSKSHNPRCVGFTRSLQQVPRYIVSESEVEASKEGRSLTDFKYACVGYSIYMDKNNDAPPTGDQKPRAELPVCVGIELLVDKRPADHHTPARAHNKEDDRGLPQHRPPKTPHPMGEEFLMRFSRNAGLVASGVARNMRKVGNYVKESIDDILYRRPK